MEINVRDDRKIVELWLMKDEKQDQVLREYLKPLYQTPPAGTRVVIFVLWRIVVKLLEKYKEPPDKAFHPAVFTFRVD